MSWSTFLLAEACGFTGTLVCVLLFQSRTLLNVPHLMYRAMYASAESFRLIKIFSDWHNLLNSTPVYWWICSFCSLSQVLWQCCSVGLLRLTTPITISLRSLQNAQNRFLSPLLSFAVHIFIVSNCGCGFSVAQLKAWPLILLAEIFSVYKWPAGGSSRQV